MRRTLLAGFLPALALALSLTSTAPAQPVSALDWQAEPPAAAERVETVVDLHGDSLVDPYLWLRDATDPAVIAHLEAENAYAARVMAPVTALEDRLFAEMTARAGIAVETAPVRFGDFWYFRWGEPEDDHLDLYRRPVGGGEAASILHLNALSATHDYFELVAWDVTRDGAVLGYIADLTGGLDYALEVVSLADGRPLTETIAEIDAFVLSPDGAGVFYIALDAAYRAYELRWRDFASGADSVLYTETDDTRSLALGATIDRRFLVLGSQSNTGSEQRLFDLRDPDVPPHLVLPWQDGRRYFVDHGGGHLYVGINDTSEALRIAVTSLAEIAAGVPPGDWRTLVPADEAAPIDSFHLLARQMALFSRRDGRPVLDIVDLATGDRRPVDMPDATYSLYGEWNPEFDTESFHFGYESPTRPYGVYAHDLATGETTLVWQDPVPDGFRSTDYVTGRLTATAADGTAIPVSVVHRREVNLDGSAPLLLEVYGAYGWAYDPFFDNTVISLLDRGVVYAIAHVRGGGEFGRAWHDGGRLAAKPNTFTDGVAAAEMLVAEGYTSADRMVLTGSSAGGLAAAATLHLRPDLFAAGVLNVPFVDVLTAMLDPSLPLTTIEYPEWGDPGIAEEYGWMRAYDPYFTLDGRAYPPLLLVAGLHDDQVPYWQPARYTARLRQVSGGEAQVLLATDMGAGHGGASGRLEGLRTWARQYAFVLGQLGILE
ncbi:MAG: prolyl oligopeptidase family serine peptidase [Azospirillaceae bacterium]